ncbi:hybrid sensor histidine kinase/response regulator transcription factor [Lutibacter oricola]|uniref:hybrid sensor histidine kinase/response regulator transcription factor n=1 Tax=Lutibacter oricola TaxID=762486 RepID=UPI0015879E9C|nr:two-component regulator propeller domain-containing protein [Lutibacter oricola]
MKLTISEGLAHNGITTLFEDSKGYLWIGTYDGLNKYDGYQLKTFKNTIDKNILVSNRVREINQDKKGNLWIGTDEGITIYNYSEEKFKNLYSSKFKNKTASGPIVRSIIINNDNGLVVCATEKDGVLVFNDDYNFLKQYVPPRSFSKEEILFHHGIELKNGNYLYSTSIGLIQFNYKTKKFKQILKETIKFSKSVSRVDNNTLLVTKSQGACFVDFEFNKKEYTFKSKQVKFKSEQLNSSLIDSVGNLWLGTLNNGIIHVNDVNSLKNNRKIKQAVFKNKVKSLRTSCIIPGINKSCWVGTFNEGLFKFELNENPFKKYSVEMGLENGVKSNFINNISVIDNSKVMISASRGGIGIFNTTHQKFKELPFNLSEKDFLVSGAAFVDSKKNTWLRVGNGLGISRVRRGSRTVERVEASEGNSLIKHIQPRSYAEDKYGNIWIGGYSGLHKISVNKKGDVTKIESLNAHPIFKTNQLDLVRYVYVDPSYEFLWIGADSSGLFRISLDNKKPLDELVVKHFVNDKNNKFSISSNFVTSIIRLPNEELWIGTEGGGICKVLESDTEPKFIPFSEKHGLSNNVVKSILYDEEHNLWISTNVGLNKFNTKDNSFRRFSKFDGLPFEDFWFSSARLNNGYMLFSGLDGLCYFNTKDISNRETLPKIEFEEISIFNKPISPKDTLNDRVLLDKRLNELNKITLKHNENVFSVKLTSLHFSNPENHFIKYRLLPINEEWIEVPSSQQYAQYNGLPPGEYKLSVMASNSLNNWTKPRELSIIIKPPFWRTIWAYILYFILGALLIYTVGYFILRFQSLNHNLEIEQLEKNNVKEMNAAKLRFFSNISHEIKTPITLISGPVSILLERFKNNADVKPKLELVQRQSKKISQLIDQVHDFQRADANLLKMNYTTFCFNSFLQNLVSDFNFMAKNDKKTLKLVTNNDQVYVSADKDKLEKILNNLINNAFKYTKTGDLIKINYFQKNNNLTVVVADTGKGIDSDDLPHVFERFYQSHIKHESFTGGSGIGLAFSKRLVDMHYGYIKVDSEVKKGSKFTVCLPIITTQTEDSQQENELKILTAENEVEAPEPQLIDSVNIESIKVDGRFSDSQIFFAEDNTDMRLFVSSVLSNFFKVKTFTNGQECLDAMENEWPDIVLSDVQMPELNGFELCKRIKTDIKTSHIPVVLLTALTAIDDQIHGLSDGADAYIKKPFNVQHLVTRVETLLRNRKKLRERFQIEFPLTLEKDSEAIKDNVFLEKLYNLMAENLDNQEIDFNDLAKKLYLNRTHFYQKVKALTNQTPFELLKMYRLKKAAEFLVQKKLSVNEVYIMTGFKSRTHFSKLFKEKYNVTPGKYASKKKSNLNN